MRIGLIFAVIVAVAVGVWWLHGPLLSNLGSVVQQGEHNYVGERVMLKGYDPVSYFGPHEGPKQGDPEISAEHDGVVYHFASAGNHVRFLKEPERYIPQYGGFCSYGVRMGQKLDIDPTAYRVVDGRLFVQLDPGTRMAWMKDETENIEVADNIWPQIRDERHQVE